MSDIINLQDPTARAEVNAAYAKLTQTIASWTQHGGHNTKTLMHEQQADFRTITRRHGLGHGATETLLFQAKTEGQRRAYDRAKAYAVRNGEPIRTLEQQPIKNDRDRYPDPDNEARDLSDTPKRLLAHITANILAAEARGDVGQLKRYRDNAQAVADEHNAIGRRAMVTGGDPFEVFKIAACAERLIEWANKVIADTAPLTAQPEPESEPEPEPEPIFLLDGARGIHLPKVFALMFSANIGLNEWRINTLQDGANNPDYFDVWHDYLDHEPLVVIDGVPHTVYMEDGDLFAVKL